MVNSPLRRPAISLGGVGIGGGGGNSKMFYVHPDPWGNDPI